MRKFWIVLLLALAFCGEALAGPGYTLDAKFAVLERPHTLEKYPSCGSTQLLHDRFRIQITDHGALVNHTWWDLYTTTDGAGYTWYALKFRAGPDQFAHMWMFLVANDRVIGGQLELYSRLPDHTPCADMVEVLGYRD